MNAPRRVQEYIWALLKKLFGRFSDSSSSRPLYWFSFTLLSTPSLSSLPLRFEVTGIPSGAKSILLRERQIERLQLSDIRLLQVYHAAIFSPWADDQVKV